MSQEESNPDVVSSPSQSEMDALLLGRIKELPTVNIKSSSWKGTLISILVIFFLCSIIAFAIYVINPDIQTKLLSNKERLKLSEFLNNKYSAQSTYNGTWISDTEITFVDTQGNFVLYDVQQNQSKILVDSSMMKQHEVSRAILSPDRKYVLFISHIKGVFRHSSLAHYKIFNNSSPINTITVRPPNAKEDVYLQAAQWGVKGSQLIFVYENNIYYMPNGLVDTFKLTDNNKNDYIYNGIPDWIYEEEILATGTAFWWSPEGTKLTYAQFNDTKVDFQEYPWYGDVVDANSQYLDRVKIKYPKPGCTNPTVKLFTIYLEDTNLLPKPVLPPTNLTQWDYYLTSVAWVTENSFIAVWFTREQNYSSYSLCSPYNETQWQCTDNLVYKESQGWVEINKVFIGPDQKHYYTLLPDKSPYKNIQVVQVEISSGKIEYLTSGHKDVTSILRIQKSEDLNTTILYYMSTREGKPGERHAYSLDLDNHKWATRQYNSLYNMPRIQRVKAKIAASRIAPKCYTCSEIELNQCLYNRIWLSTQATFYVHECLGPEIPYSMLRRTDNDTFMQPWLNNQALEDSLQDKLMPTVRTEIINITTYALIVQMFMPPSFNEDEIIKYPLLIQVYGGPGSQNVNENYKMNFGKYLASARDIIYAYIDGRGSGFQGETMKYHLYHKLGTVEIEDQITVAKYLRDKYKFINKEAIGIWGWSYGGYATAMILAKDVVDPVFACGISVAPVTSWLLYDSAYTERYMGLPKDNLKSYFKSDIMHLANNFKGKKYLLIHGTADDNVHVQNSMVLIKALNQANVMFQTQIYPDENHGLPGSSMHLYNRMDAFWEECFQMNSVVEEIGLRRRRIVKHDSVQGTL